MALQKYAALLGQLEAIWPTETIREFDRSCRNQGLVSGDGRIDNADAAEAVRTFKEDLAKKPHAPH